MSMLLCMVCCEMVGSSMAGERINMVDVEEGGA